MCLEQTEREGGGERREERGRSCRALGSREDLGFYSREVGVLEGCGQRGVPCVHWRVQPGCWWDLGEPLRETRIFCHSLDFGIFPGSQDWLCVLL